MGEPVHDDDKGWTAKDLAAHQLAYDHWTAAQLEGLRRGTPTTLREAYDWDREVDVVAIPDLTERNQKLYEIYRDRSAEDVREAFRATFERLYRAVDAFSDEQLADPHLWDRTRGRSLIEIMPNQTYLHYGRHTAPMQALAEWLEERRGR
jgi:hypothetical protein